ncbi:MAG: hypothetical protein ACNA8W_16895, partial [Bradymonadaceae bacterium]
SSDRDVFLPAPGRYTIVVTDLRNLTSQPNVGGAAYDYRLSMSEVPLPEAIPLSSSASPPSFEHDHELRVYEVDVAGEDALVVRARGVARNLQSALLPSIVVLDEEDGSVLSYTIGGQVDDSTLRVDLSTKLSGQETVLVMADYIQAQGQNDMLVEVSTPEISEDLETLQEDRDRRDADLLWLVPGASVEGVIGPPRQVSDTQLTADTDYFLFTSRRGESYRVRVAPLGTSPVLPRVEVGVFVNDGFSFYFLQDHVAPAPTTEGTATELVYFINALDDGETAIRLRHDPNLAAGTSEGGPAYRYRIELERVEAEPVPLGALPASLAIDIPAGGTAMASFMASEGDFVTVSHDNWRFDTRVTAREGWRHIGQSLSEISMLMPDDGEYWVDLRDFGGVASASPVNLSVERTPVTELEALPQEVTGTLATADDVHAYRFTAQAGDQLDLRVATGREWFPNMEVYDVSTFSVLRSTSLGHAQFNVPRDGDYIVRLNAYGLGQQADFDYILGIEAIDPEAPGALPLEVAATLDEAARAHWYRFDVEAGKRYRFAIATLSDDLRPTMAIHNPQTLTRIRTTGDRQFLWQSTVDGEVFLSLYDIDQLGSPDFDYTLRIEELEVTPLEMGVPVDVVLTNAVDGLFFSVTAEPGALDVRVDTDEPVYIELLAAQTFAKVNSLAEPLGRVHYASSSARDYLIAIRPHETITEPREFSLSAAVIAPAEAVEVVEPNNILDEAHLIDEFPAALMGSLGEEDREDNFILPLEAGQYLWAVTMDASGQGDRSMDATLELIDEQGTLVTTNRWSGEGDFPALYGTPIEADGTWQLRVRLPDGANDEGSYYLYVFVR